MWTHISYHGDGPIPRTAGLHFHTDLVDFPILRSTNPPEPVITWSDTAMILQVFSAKTIIDGYHEWSGRVIRTRDAKTIGFADIAAYELED